MRKWICALTVWFVADCASQLLLTLHGFPEAVGVNVNTRSTGRIRRPATKNSVTVVCPSVVCAILNRNRLIIKLYPT